MKELSVSVSETDSSFVYRFVNQALLVVQQIIAQRLKCLFFKLSFYKHRNVVVTSAVRNHPDWNFL